MKIRCTEPTKPKHTLSPRTHFDKQAALSQWAQNINTNVVKRQIVTPVITKDIVLRSSEFSIAKHVPTPPVKSNINAYEPCI